MAAERPSEPTLVQHVEAVRGEFREEQRALEELTRKNGLLREGLERLETRKQALQGELEALRQEQSMSPPRLPAVLAPPFTVKVQQGLRLLVVTLLFFAYLSAALILVPHGLEAWPYVAAFWGLLGGVMLVTLLASPRWRFDEASAKAGGIHINVNEQSQSTAFTYWEVTDVQVLVTPAQKRRGVGTVVIHREGVPDRQWVTLRNVPEPERLAEWIRSKADSARNRGR